MPIFAAVKETALCRQNACEIPAVKSAAVCFFPPKSVHETFLNRNGT